MVIAASRLFRSDTGPSTVYSYLQSVPPPHVLAATCAARRRPVAQLASTCILDTSLIVRGQSSLDSPYKAVQSSPAKASSSHVRDGSGRLIESFIEVFSGVPSPHHSQAFGHQSP